ncbi:MAG: ribbon-helix-helix protein, CopG family [Thermoleophilia bacterium]|nr:ribbon-helix-helix protein, CopG family [Thermoleophilia bacterium]
MAKLDARLELRLDKRTLERLERRAAADHLSVAQMVRRAIARELDADDVPCRERALERGLSLSVPVPDDPQELARELGARYSSD